jgi:hypothetical protein
LTDLRTAVARLVAAELAECRRGFAPRKAWPAILREIVEANLAMEEFYTVPLLNRHQLPRLPSPTALDVHADDLDYMDLESAARAVVDLVRAAWNEIPADLLAAGQKLSLPQAIARLAAERNTVLQPTNHPRVEEASPRFKATGLRILYASSCDEHNFDRLVHVAMHAPAPFSSTLNVSVRVPPLPENRMFGWDNFVDLLQAEDGPLRDLPAIRSKIAENLRAAGHRYASAAILAPSTEKDDDEEIFW